MSPPMLVRAPSRIPSSTAADNSPIAAIAAVPSAMPIRRRTKPPADPRSSRTAKRRASKACSFERIHSVKNRAGRSDSHPFTARQPETGAALSGKRLKPLRQAVHKEGIWTKHEIAIIHAANLTRLATRLKPPRHRA